MLVGHAEHKASDYGFVHDLLQLHVRRLWRFELGKKTSHLVCVERTRCGDARPNHVALGKVEAVVVLEDALKVLLTGMLDQQLQKGSGQFIKLAREGRLKRLYFLVGLNDRAFEKAAQVAAILNHSKQQVAVLLHCVKCLTLASEIQERLGVAVRNAH